MDILESAVRSSMQRHPWESARGYIVKDILDAKLSKPNITVLDVGCGDGYLVTELAKQYSSNKFIGLDPKIKAGHSFLMVPRKRLNIEFIDDFKQIPPSVSVDLVMLLDVLEHIEDDERFFEELLKNVTFSNKAEILITVPSFNFLWSNRDDFLKHFRRYSLNSLSKLVRNKTSWTIKRRGYFFFSLLLPRLIQATLGKFKKNTRVKTSLSNWHIHRHLTSMIKFVLILDYKACGLLAKFKIYLPGLSCYLHLQRQ